MEYQIIMTKFGTESIYVPSEKMLYIISKGRKNEYVCYQTVLKSTNKKTHKEHIGCTARIQRLQNGLCERSNEHIQHTAHPNHEVLVSDKLIMKNIAKHCESYKTEDTEDAHKIPNRHIFQKEIARYIKDFQIRQFEFVSIQIQGKKNLCVYSF